MTQRLNTAARFGMIAALGVMSGCVTVSDMQDARVLGRGEEVIVASVEVQLQTEQRVTLNESKGDTWPIFPVAMVGMFRARQGLSDWLEVNYHIFNPLLFEGLVVLGGGFGLKAQLWGHAPGAATAGALMMRGEGYGAFVSGSSTIGAMGVTMWTVGMPLSLYLDWGALTVTPKGAFEAVGIVDGGAGTGVSAGASFGLRVGQGKGSVLLEITTLKALRGGLMTSFGVGWAL